ncbi:MAG: lipopolysaccharide biosynthesis protein [Muribaculaceae bacterium]|nr:lipopolysaccharide biosynthesis protein [Muribaculaceae bacterium]
MAMTMLVQLYTSRVILNILGVTDFGIWNLVASVVVSISFITGPLTIATQRFISFELGKKDFEAVRTVFSQSILLYLFFAGFIVIVLETAGLWFLNNKLHIPESSIGIANIVFQLSIASFIFTLIRMPYDATIIANEKMDFYAYMSIADVVLKLGIVYLLLVFKRLPHLAVYAVLTLFVNFLIMLIYRLYCRNKFPSQTKINFKVEKKTMKSMTSFFGWSLMGAFSVMTANQGVSMVLNVFFGVVINATVGIATQVGNAVNQFIGNFQTAFNPQIVKSYAGNDESRFISLIINCCRISYCLMMLASVPLIFNMESILRFWLGQIPEYLTVFCQLTLAYMIIDVVSSAINMGIYATGKIRGYQIAVSVCILMVLPLSYLALKIGFDAPSVIIVRLLVSVISLAIRVITIGRNVSGPIVSRFLKLIPKMILIGIIAVSVPYLLLRNIETSWFISFVVDLLWAAGVIYFIGINKAERNLIKKTVFRHP